MMTLSRRMSRDIHCGRVLLPDEAIQWEGRPSWVGLFVHSLRARWIGAYLLVISTVAIIVAPGDVGPFQRAGGPILSAAFVGFTLAGLSILLARTTRYVITTRRVILRYGIVFPVSLSIPFRQVKAMSVAVGSRQCGDIALALPDEARLSYVKLWPHVRLASPWRVQPMLRQISAAGMVATTLARILQDASSENSEPMPHRIRSAR